MGFPQKIRGLLQQKDVLWEMSLKELKAKYSGSFLGIWWAVFLPLLLAASINFVFVHVYKVQTKNFTIFLLSGILPWTFFSSALMEATQSFFTRAVSARQGIFPREFIPLSGIIANFLNFLVGFLILLPLFFVASPQSIFLLPQLLVVLALYFFFSVGFGLLFGSLNVFWRDLSHLLSVGMMLWFWITPVFYSAEDLIFPYRWVCLLNPVTPFITAFQKIIFYAAAPSFLVWLAVFSVSFLVFLSGYFVYLIKERELLKRI
jgi:ABC-type polysaccharide/polyol phosphate export permease